MSTLKKSLLFVFFSAFVFLFSLRSINTIDSKVLIYDELKPYVQDEFDINFYSFNVKDLKKVFGDLNIEILSVKPLNELYYNKEMKVQGNDLDQMTYYLMTKYSSIVKDMGYDEASLYFEINGFNIEKMKIRCLVKDLMELEKRIDII